jgi:pyruvate formate lyase activating enzyme
MEFESTPVLTLEKHYDIAKQAGLEYAYIGNVPGHKLENTYCPECGNLVIQRYGFNVDGWNLDQKNCCIQCGHSIPIVGTLQKKSKRWFHFIE